MAVLANLVFDGSVAGSAGANPYAASITKIAVQSINSASDTQITFDTEGFDNHGSMVDLANNQIVIQVNGRYRATGIASLEIDEFEATKFVGVSIIKNATNIGAHQLELPVGTTNATFYQIKVLAEDDFVATDTVRLHVYHTLTGATDFGSANAYTEWLLRAERVD